MDQINGKPIWDKGSDRVGKRKGSLQLLVETKYSWKKNIKKNNSYNFSLFINFV